MNVSSIQSRMLVVALLPVTLVSLTLAGIFLLARIGDNEDANSQRARALARQVAAASEYGLFSANIAHLQGIAQGAMHEPDVRSVAIMNADGMLLAVAGSPGYKMAPTGNGLENEQFDPATGLNLYSQPINASQIPLADLFESRAAETVAAPQPLGRVLIEFSRDAALRHQREMLLLGLAGGLAGMLLGSMLALRLGRRVTRPIDRVSGMVASITRGELSTRLNVRVDDPLQELQRGLNQMAERLQAGRAELEQRVDEATLALREKKEEAETATLAKSRFLAAASHDLRQPTHALGMFVARLGQLPHTAETRGLIENLERSVQAMQDLLDGLLDVSRLDARAVQVHVRAFALVDIFEQLRSELNLVAVEKGLRLRIRPCHVGVLSDPALLHRILLNLLGNSLRYTHTGGVLLACRLTANRRLVSIEVWDSGIGIAPEHQEAIFKEFYQIGNLERDRGKGLGLGLNIVERTAQLLGHRLQMRSRPGVGTRFSIEVPLAPPDVVLDRRGALRPGAAESLAGLVVMVIEDDALAREAVVSLLVSWGCVVIEADGLPGALGQLKERGVPQTIISDFRLGCGDNGIEVIRQLRAAAGHMIPACLTSGDTDPGLMTRAKEANLSMLYKPVRPAKLRSLLRRLALSRQDDDAALP